MPQGTMTNRAEVNFLRGYALEKSGRKEEAIAVYFSIADSLNSYHGGLATERLLVLIDNARRPQVLERLNRVKKEAAVSVGEYPAPYRDTILRATTKRKVDPRLVLALMRQESSFRPYAKSPAAARGLLQITIDTASKYATQAGYAKLQDSDLYQPETSITIGSEYVASLQKLFPNMPEAVAASYNGGEDNVARWLKRAKSSEPFIFASEVGFAETKNYVFKVMSNYRAYQLLYSTDLKRL
jgi:soluble lytic murein transglycosylase